MELPLTADSLENVPEAARALYQQTEDGKYKLPVQTEDVSGLKSALQKEREARKEEERRAQIIAKKFEGVDPDKYREMFAKMREAEESGAIQSGDAEKLKSLYQRQVEEAQGKFQQGLSERDQRIAALENEIRSLTVNRSISEWAIANGVREEAVGDFTEMVARNVERDADGKLAVKDSIQSFEEFLAAQKEARGYFFKPNPASGSGATAGRAGGSPGTPRSKMTLSEKTAAIERLGMEGYLALPLT